MAGSKNKHWSAMMQKAQQGDEAAYQALLMEISQAIRGFLSKRVSNAQVVEDLLQEVLLGIHKARHTYESDRPFSAWMYAIARYKLVDYFRKYKKESVLTSLDDIDSESMFVSVESMENPNLDLKNMAEKLPEKQKKVFWDLKVEGLSIKDVASKMGMTETAVKVNAHRAYKKIRKLIEEQGR